MYIVSILILMQAVQHVVMTAGIFLFCLYFALGVPGVGAVWSICGSSVRLLEICYHSPYLWMYICNFVGGRRGQDCLVK